MLSKKAFRAYQLYLRTLWKNYILHIEWNPKSKDFQTTGSSRRLRAYFFLLAVYTCHWVFQIVNVYRRVVNSRDSRTFYRSATLDCLWLMMSTETCLVQWILLLHRDWVMGGLNAFVQTCERYYGQVKSDAAKEGRAANSKLGLQNWMHGIAELCLRSSNLVILVNTLALFSVFLYSPSNSRFVYSMVPELLRVFPVQLICGLLEFHFVMTCMRVSFFQLVLTWTYIINMTSWLTQLRTKVRMHRVIMVRNGSKIFSETVQEYRQLQLLNQIYDVDYSRILILPAIALIGAGQLVLLYGTLKLHEHFPPPIIAFFAIWSVLLFVAVIAWYVRLGDLNENSVELLRSLKAGLTPTQVKLLQSLRPLGIKAGGRRGMRRVEGLQYVLLVCRVARSIMLIH